MHHSKPFSRGIVNLRRNVFPLIRKKNKKSVFIYFVKAINISILFAASVAYYFEGGRIQIFHLPKSGRWFEWKAHAIDLVSKYIYILKSIQLVDWIECPNKHWNNKVWPCVCHLFFCWPILWDSNFNIFLFYRYAWYEDRI